MPDATLHGNGENCPACALRRENDPWQTEYHPCNFCQATGRVPYTEARIVADAVAWAKEHYWRHFDERCDAHNRGDIVTAYPAKPLGMSQAAEHLGISREGVPCKIS